MTKQLCTVASMTLVSLISLAPLPPPHAIGAPTVSAPLVAVINEIAWMGTTTSHTHEWIEFYNNTGSSIDLTGWTLRAADGTPNITPGGSIPATAVGERRTGADTEQFTR